MGSGNMENVCRLFALLWLNLFVAYSLSGTVWHSKTRQAWDKWMLLLGEYRHGPRGNLMLAWW